MLESVSIPDKMAKSISLKKIIWVSFPAFF